MDDKILDFPAHFATLRHETDYEPFAIILARDSHALRKAIIEAEHAERYRLHGHMSKPVLSYGVLPIGEVSKWYSPRVGALPYQLTLLSDLVAGRVDALTF